MSLFVAGAVYLVKVKCHFSWQAQYTSEGQVSLFVAGAVLGEVLVSLVVAGAIFGDVGRGGLLLRAL